MTTLVDYSDIDFTPISDEQYCANLYNQIRDPELSDDLSVEELEAIIDGPPQSLCSEMNTVLPDDILWLIWKTYNSTFVMKELISSQKFIWATPSPRLIQLCTGDKGCIQHSHHELEDMMDDENRRYLSFCVDIKCENCKHYGFPCANLAWYGFRNDFLEGLWDPNFD